MIVKMTELAVHLDLYDQRDFLPHTGRIDNGDVGNNGPVFLHAPDTALNRGRRKANRLCDRALRSLVVSLQNLQDCKIKPIQFATS
ncbi:hypothetical protein AC628_28385 [Bradyrhizobium sp. NAS96.2]|nr:hypothetical protein AC628_28385 [Bradyrhizobium sp. NAS96.2]